MQEALTVLMEEKPYRKIKVAEITDRARVARPTFYLHFKSKDELMLSVIDEFLTQFFEDLDEYLEGFPDNSKVMLQFVLEEMAKHANTIQMIIKADRESLLLELFRQYMDIATKRLAVNKRFSVNADALKYAGDILAGSAFLLSINWVKEGMPHSPNVMSQFYFEMMQTGLERLLTGELDALLN
jgi:hypothetical protein